MKCPLCADDDATLERVWARIQDAKVRGDKSPYFKKAPSWFLESLDRLPEAPDYSLDELSQHLIDFHMMDDEDERIQFGEHYYREIQAQVELEKKAQT